MLLAPLVSIASAWRRRLLLVAVLAASLVPLVHSQCAASCSSHGECVDDACVCNGLWKGPNCTDDSDIYNPVRLTVEAVATLIDAVLLLYSTHRIRVLSKKMQISTQRPYMILYMLIFVSSLVQIPARWLGITLEGRDDPRPGVGIAGYAMLYIFQIAQTNIWLLINYIWARAAKQSIWQQRAFLTLMTIENLLFLLIAVMAVFTSYNPDNAIFVLVLFVWLSDAILIVSYGYLLIRKLSLFPEQNADLLYKIRRFLVLYIIPTALLVPWYINETTRWVDTSIETVGIAVNSLAGAPVLLVSHYFSFVILQFLRPAKTRSRSSSVDRDSRPRAGSLVRPSTGSVGSANRRTSASSRGSAAAGTGAALLAAAQQPHSIQDVPVPATEPDATEAAAEAGDGAAAAAAAAAVPGASGGDGQAVEAQVKQEVDNQPAAEEDNAAAQEPAAETV